MTHLGPSLRRAKVRERPGRRVAAAALVSLLLNGLIFLLLARAGAFTLPEKPTRVSLTPLSASQWAANRAIGPGGAGAARPKPPAAPAAKAPEPPDSIARGQVVDVAPSPDSTPPKSTRFLSDRDSSVAKETRSRYARPGYERTLPTPQAPGVQTAPEAGAGGKSAKEIPGKEGPPAAPTAQKGETKVALAPESGGDLAGGRAAGVAGCPSAPGIDFANFPPSPCAGALWTPGACGVGSVCS